MDREKTYGGVDPEIFELMKDEESTQLGEFMKPLRQLHSQSINEQETDELGKVIMDLESSGEQH